MRRRDAFTIVELLVVIAIIALLISILLPALGRARESARTAVCMAKQRQIGIAWAAYANEHDGRAAPFQESGNAGAMIYWWGAENGATGRVDFDSSPLSPYFEADTGESSPLECPSQPASSFAPQGQLGNAFSSTYGYNAYYLVPGQWVGNASLGRPWRRLETIDRPSDLFVFGDTMLVLAGELKNSALLDPPQTFRRRRGWRDNDSPTTSFRHAGSTVTAQADGSVGTTLGRPEWMRLPEASLGSVGTTNGPHYVPDWEDWK
ncbi:MAG: prepilin-type N-terminal cleavage/methylation domain-containing protein [Phycisphaerales bacterium]